MENKYHGSLERITDGKKIFKHNRISIEKPVIQTPKSVQLMVVVQLNP